MLIEQLSGWYPAGIALICSAAVVAAYRVGRLQSGRVARQLRIQANAQAAALYNSRLDVFIVTQTYVHETLRTTRRPSDKISEAFVSAKMRANWLFSPSVSESLSGVHLLAEGLFAITETIERTGRRDQWLTEAKQQQIKALEWLNARALSLPKMFEPDLSPFRWKSQNISPHSA